MSHIRVSDSARRSLQRKRPDATYSEAIAAMLGEWHGGRRDVNVADVNVSNGDATTARVSESVKRHLESVRSEMGVSSVGAAVSVLVDNTRM